MRMAVHHREILQAERLVNCNLLFGWGLITSCLRPREEQLHHQLVQGYHMLWWWAINDSELILHDLLDGEDCAGPEITSAKQFAPCIQPVD